MHESTMHSFPAHIFSNFFHFLFNFKLYYEYENPAYDERVLRNFIYIGRYTCNFLIDGIEKKFANFDV